MKKAIHFGLLVFLVAVVTIIFYRNLYVQNKQASLDTKEIEIEDSSNSLNLGFEWG